MHFVDESRRHGFDHWLYEADFQRTLTAEERARLGSDQGGAEGVEGRPSELDARFFQDKYYGGIPLDAECRLRVAAAGQGEGLRFKVSAADTSQWYSSRRVAERVSGYKILIGEGTD
jgi:hypothetical protein